MLTTTAYCNALREMFKGYILSKHNNGGGRGVSYQMVFQGNFLELKKKKKKY